MKTEENIASGFGIVGLSFILLGIIANIIAVAVLRKKSMRCLGTKLLVCLAYLDIVLLFLNSFRLAEDLRVGVVAKEALSELKDVTYPVFMTVYMAETYLTSLITIQRYVSVAKPMAARSLMSQRRLVIIMALLGAWCIVFNIPQWVVFHPNFYFNKHLSMTWVRHATYFTPNKKPFYKSTFYEIAYIGYLGFIFRFLIPMTAMFIFNILIVRIVKEHTFFRRTQNIHDQSKNSDTRLTIVIIAITTTSLVSTFLDALDLLLFAFLNWESKCSLYCIVFGYVGDFVAVVNSSMNCIYYCVFGGKFRNICLGMFCPKPKTEENNSYTLTSRLVDSSAPSDFKLTYSRSQM